MRVGLQAIRELAFVLSKPAAVAVIQNVGDSNIVLRFYGWLDQNRTDFLKARSLAIQAAKTALETGGFALPEPIYRLRFDDSPPSALRSGSTAPQKRQSPAKRTIEELDHDVAPDTQIAKLVEEERTEKAQKDDLLDLQRPIE